MYIYNFIYKRLKLFVIRADTKIYIEIFTVTIISYLIDRVIWFCNIQLKILYLSIYFYTQKIYSCIWIFSVLSASPVSIFDLSILHFITQINNKLVEDFNSLVKAIKLLSENQYCQIICISRIDILRIFFVRPNIQNFKIF